MAERTHEGLASPPKDQSWGPDSIVLRLGPGVSLPTRTGRTDDMRAWSHRPRLFAHQKQHEGHRRLEAAAHQPQSEAVIPGHGRPQGERRTDPAFSGWPNRRTTRIGGPPAVVPPKRARLGRARPGALRARNRLGLPRPGNEWRARPVREMNLSPPARPPRSRGRLRGVRRAAARPPRPEGPKFTRLSESSSKAGRASAASPGGSGPAGGPLRPPLYVRDRARASVGCCMLSLGWLVSYIR